MKRDRLIDSRLIVHIQEILNDAGYTNINVLDAYPDKPITALPAVAVHQLNVERTRAEVGSHNSYGELLFVVDVLSQYDGERQDIADVILNNMSKITITGDLINITGLGDNLISNPNFDSLAGWTTSSLVNVAEKSCIPIIDSCVYYASCPWRLRQFQNSEWFLATRYKVNGSYSLGLFAESGFQLATFRGTTISLEAGTYTISGQMWKEDNFGNNMGIQVLNSADDSIISETELFSATQNQQDETRTWISKTAQFTISESKTAYIMGYATTKRDDLLSDDVGTPCQDHTHAGWDALGLFKQEITQTGVGDETLPIGDVRKLGFSERHKRYEAAIGIGISDYKCEK